MRGRCKVLWGTKGYGRYSYSLFTLYFNFCFFSDLKSKISKSLSGLSCRKPNFKTNQSFNDIAVLLFIYSNKRRAPNSVACNELPCTDLQCWKSLVLKLMKLIWPADSSSPIDLCLFRLLCSSQRLIKINPAAKLAQNAFSFSVFLSLLFLDFPQKSGERVLRLGAREYVSEIRSSCWLDETWRASDKHQRADGLRWAGFLQLTCGPSAGMADQCVSCVSQWNFKRTHQVVRWQAVALAFYFTFYDISL